MFNVGPQEYCYAEVEHPHQGDPEYQLCREKCADEMIYDAIDEYRCVSDSCPNPAMEPGLMVVAPEGDEGPDLSRACGHHEGNLALGPLTGEEGFVHCYRRKPGWVDYLIWLCPDGMHYCQGVGEEGLPEMGCYQMC